MWTTGCYNVDNEIQNVSESSNVDNCGQVNSRSTEVSTPVFPYH